MRVFENLLRVFVPVRLRAGIALLGCFAVILLLALAASAQDETPSASPETDAAVESPVDEAAAAAEGGAESDLSEAGGDASEAGDDAAGAEEVDDFADELAPPEIPLPSADIEEIRVTGERAVGTPQDAPISAVGFDADVILKEGIRDIRDLSNFTPSLEIKSAFAASNPTIFIRGVGLDDFNANAASAVAIYQDGVYMQSPAGQLFQFFDVEGVEVLRGPQGALYRNASAGAILVNSRKPTDEFEAYVTATYGNFNDIEVVSAVSGPLVPDYLSGRLAGSWGVRDGITENRCSFLAPDQEPCAPRGDVFVVEPGLNRYTNDINAYGARGQLLFRPPEVDTEWLLNIHGGQNFSRAFQYQNRGVVFQSIDPDDEELQIPVPFPLEPPKFDSSGYRDTDRDPFAGDYDIDGPEELDLWGGNLKGVWRFEDYELESVTGYEWHDRLTRENSDGNPNFMLISYYGDTAWQASQELNLRGEWTPTALGDGDWIVGAFYIQEDLDVTNFYDQSGGVDLIQEYSQNMRNFAAYAQSEYKIQPGCTSISCDVTVDLGLRYNVEYKEFDITACGTAGGNCGVSLEARDDAVWDGLSGDISFAWHFLEDNNVYAKYSRGWKGGHFNGGATGRFDIITPVQPEIVDSYELGLRSLWFDERLMLNLTGFYYDYQDLQVFQLEQTPAGFPIAKLVNANDALVYGLELDMGASPIEGMNVTLNASWVESEYKDFKIGLPFTIRKPKPGGGFFPTITFRQEFDYSGNPLIASPRFSVTGSVDYRMQLPWRIGFRELGYVTPRFSFSWKDDVFYDATSGQGAMQNFPTATFGQTAFWIFNGSLSWLSPSERIEVTGWVHNMTNEIYKTQSFDLSRGFRMILDAYADPRTYGVSATISF